METGVTAKISDSCVTFACVGWANGEADLGKGLILHAKSSVCMVAGIPWNLLEVIAEYGELHTNSCNGAEASQ